MGCGNVKMGHLSFLLRYSHSLDFSTIDLHFLQLRNCCYYMYVVWQQSSAGHLMCSVTCCELTQWGLYNFYAMWAWFRVYLSQKCMKKLLVRNTSGSRMLIQLVISRLNNSGETMKHLSPPAFKDLILFKICLSVRVIIQKCIWPVLHSGLRNSRSWFQQRDYGDQ